MQTLRFRRESLVLRELGDDMQGDALFQAGLFALLLTALGGGCAACYFVFWRQVLAAWLR